MNALMVLVLALVAPVAALVAFPYFKRRPVPEMA